MCAVHKVGETQEMVLWTHETVFIVLIDVSKWLVVSRIDTRSLLENGTQVRNEFIGYKMVFLLLLLELMGLVRMDMGE